MRIEKKMMNFEILCVTMHQTDFSKIQEMNVHSDIVFSNQSNKTSYEEIQFESHTAKMITTQTRGVGINRNLALTYATGEYCLFADDDVTYVDDLEEIVVGEFKAHPDADVFIFNLLTDDKIRIQKQYLKTRKVALWEKMPWGGFRIAIKLSSVRKANVWFTTLFGGGCIFPCGEDSMWLIDAKKKGLQFYVSDKIIGKVSFEKSTWFTGYDEKFYYGKGAFNKALYGKLGWLKNLYILIRTRRFSTLTTQEIVQWLRKGKSSFDLLKGFDS